MTDSIQKRRVLLELLYARTVDKKLEWAFDGDDSVHVTLGPIIAYIISTSNENFEQTYRILVYQDGQLKDQFDDEVLGSANIGTGVSGMPNYFRLCEALFDTARRQASGADGAIDMALTYLLANE